VAKGLLEAVLATSGLEWSARPARRPFLHPGRSASVEAQGGRKIGFVGELHPLVARAFELGDVAVAAFELDFQSVAELAPGPTVHRDVTAFPAVLQDIAVIVPEEVSAAEVLATVRAGSGPLLQSARVFDLYRGPQTGEAHKSLALRLEFRAPDRTLTDEEVAERRTAIEGALAELGGRLRA
jgi:phenylalanyl-tRNA synthetase beta chain